jgi:alkylation response protein AidB-like acyl-CoA dehydrogenase
MFDDERGYSDELWNKMAELGWMGLMYPEEFGGAGLTMVDLVVVLEEMGRVSLPGPFFSTVCLGGLVILEAGSNEQKKNVLPGLVAGKTKATFA